MRNNETIKYSLAIDENGTKIKIENAKRGNVYYYPFCNNKMLPRKGSVKIWHYAHKEACTETWHYDMSEWHRNWQSHFDNTEEIFVNANKKTYS